MSERYNRNPNTACVICGKEIYKRPSAIKLNKGHVYCSIYCYSVSNRKEKPCVVCGKLLLAGLNKKTCSRECANIHRSGIKYKTGRLRDKVRNYWLLKKRLVAIRGSVCERCRYNRVEILEVHHIDRNRQNNALENLELICPNCHAEEHHLSRNLKVAGKDAGAV